MRILLIEPNPVLAAQITVFLERAGHELNSLQTAQGAINHTDKQVPDLVVMELLLAGHSGIEFLHEFRSYPDWQHVPVVVYSRIPRTALAASNQTLGRLGVVSYLYKPETSLKKLASRLQTLADKLDLEPSNLKL